jgi:hypothetical protein
MNFWEATFPAIRRAIEREMSPNDIAVLEKQEKQLQMLIDELKAIQQSHRQTVQMLRQKQQLTKEAEKVLSAIQTGNTDGITGNDMAQLIKAMKNNEIFVNGKRVNEVVSEHNELTDGLLSKLKAMIDEHKQRETTLPKPDHIGNSRFTVDFANSAAAVVDNDTVTVRTGMGGMQPVFAKEQLIDGQSCEIEVVNAALKQFLIGVATAELRNRADKYNDKNALWIYGDGIVCSEGK